MNENYRKVEHKRTLADHLISGFNVARYSLTEPVRLKLARKKYSHFYTDKNSKPLISIVLPTYRRWKLLTERCIPPILSQTYTNFELIIIGDSKLDGHTPGDTAQLLKQMRDPRIKFVDIPEYTKYPKETKSRWFVGGVPARNEGFKKVHGTWIAELDDDDVFLPDHLESLLKFAQKGDHEFVSASYITYRNGQETLVDVKDMKAPRIGGVETWLYRSYLSLFKANINAWRKGNNRPQDLDRQDRMIRAGVRFGFLDQVVSKVLPLPGNNTIGVDALNSARYAKDGAKP